MDVVIFLAPISVFDQSLAEDKDINRLVGTHLRIFVANTDKGLVIVRLLRIVEENLWKPGARIRSVHYFTQQN